MKLIRRLFTVINVIAVTFFFSGFSSLVYQIVWQRYISFFLGSDTIASTITVAAFLAGLGLGNLGGGYLADFISNRSRLVVFALAEFGLCVFGFCTKIIFYDFLYGSALVDISSRPLIFSILFIVMLIPSTFMGLTLPLLSKSFSAQGLDITRSIGSLYSINTFGACVGAFLTTFIILPLFGFDKGFLVASGLNLFVGLVTLLMIFFIKKSNQGPVAEVDTVSVEMNWNTSFIGWLPLYFLSGFIAIALEIIWFRLCGNIIKSDSYTYGMILSFYLLGLALGGIVGTWLSKKGDARLYFLGLQALVPMLAIGLLVFFLVLASERFNVLGLYTHLQNYDTSFSVRNLVILYGFVPFVLILVPTMVMGATFPLLQQAVNQSFESLGRKMGWLMLSNIGGNILGAFVTTFILLEYFGTSLALKTLGFVSMVFIVFMFTKAKLMASILYILLIASILFFYNNDTLYAKIQATPKEKLIYIERASGVSSIKPSTDGEPMSVVYSNNLGQSWIPYMAGDLHLLLGAAPVFFHPNPQKVAIIGLGSGCTLFGAAGRSTIQKLVCYEIMEGQKEMVEKYGKTGYKPALQLFQNPVVQLIEADGRYELFKSDETYDIIEADALRPTSAYSGNLYSVEYFSLLKQKLRPGGLAVTWAPTKRIFNSFCSTFPYVYQLNGILFGTDRPLDHSIEKFQANFMNDPLAKSYFSNAGIELQPFVMNWFNQLKPVQPQSWDKNEINTDLYPVDELYRSRIAKMFQ